MDKRKNIVIFYPHNPEHPRHGSHVRALQQIKDLGAVANVFLASTLHTTDTAWPLDLRTCAKALGVQEVLIFERSRYAIGEIGSRIVRLLELIGRKRLIAPMESLGSSRTRNRSMHKWFKHLTRRCGANVVVINYAQWGFLAEGLGQGVHKVLELHDLLSINHFLSAKVSTQMQLGSGIPRLKSNPTPVRYISSVEMLSDECSASLSKEVQTCSTFDLIWTIAHREQTIIDQMCPGLRVETVLPKVEQWRGTTVQGSFAMLPVGPNIFNLYSLLYFLDFIEPMISYPENGKIIITGSVTKGFLPNLPSRFEYRGLVKNYLETMASARFVIAPTKVGTGQQIKIFEALCSGVPVVCFSNAAPPFMESVTHGAILVDTDEAFAYAVSSMWNDEALYQAARIGTRQFKKLASSFPDHKDSLRAWL